MVIIIGVVAYTLGVGEVSYGGAVEKQNSQPMDVSFQSMCYHLKTTYKKRFIPKIKSLSNVHRVNNVGMKLISAF